VVCLDVDEKKIRMLNNGEVPIFEPGLAAMVKKCEAASHLRFTTDVEAAVHHGEFQLIAVGTPFRRGWLYRSQTCSRGRARQYGLPANSWNGTSR
jgi:UDP-glucose 6-dehydrogenase